MSKFPHLLIASAHFACARRVSIDRTEAFFFFFLCHMNHRATIAVVRAEREKLIICMATLVDDTHVWNIQRYYPSVTSIEFQTTPRLLVTTFTSSIHADRHAATRHYLSARERRKRKKATQKTMKADIHPSWDTLLDFVLIKFVTLR